MYTNLQSSDSQKQYDLQFDLVTELLKMDDDATVLDASLRAKLTELKQLSIELQRKPFEETVEAADANGIDWGEIWRKVIEAGVQYATYWFQPGEKAALFNDTNDVITVLTYDQRDFLRWVPHGRYTIAPRKPEVIYARGNTTFQAAIRGRVHNVRIGGQHVFNGTTVIGH
jgi:hypothetical protein